MSIQSICLGIDLGTSNSCISHYKNGGTGHLEVINSMPDNKPITPSYVQISEGQLIVGNLAKRKASEGEGQVFYGVKRLIGRLYDNIKNEFKNYSFKIINKDGKPMIPLEFKGKKYELFPEHISAIVLNALYKYTENRGYDRTNDVVITVPANFNDYQRRSTMDAGKVAGLNVLSVISEPTAAALYYVYKQRLTNSNMKLLVYDFGGGTLDVSLVQVKNNEFTILATSGNTTVGGMDIDREILESIGRRFVNKHKINIFDEENTRECGQMRLLAEEAKIALSSAQNYSIACTSKSGVTEKVDINRTFLETLCEKVFKLIGGPIDEVLKLTKLKPEDIDDVIMIGGSSNIPYVQNLVAKKLKKTKLEKKVDPDQAVSLGAAIYGAILKKAKIDNFPSGIKLKDVTPMKISIAVTGGFLQELIPKNVVRPASSEWKRYTTVRDGVDEISLQIYEGDSDRPSQCYKVGEFAVKVQPKPRGQEYIYARVDVTDDKIAIYGTKEKPKDGEMPKPLKVEERKNAHTPDEIIKMRNDINDFNSVAEEELTIPSEAFSKWLREVRTLSNKIKDKGTKKSLQDKIAAKRSWLGDNSEANKAEIEKHKNDIIDFLKKGAPELLEKINIK